MARAIEPPTVKSIVRFFAEGLRDRRRHPLAGATVDLVDELAPAQGWA